MISYIIYNTYIFNHIYIYIHIQYVIGSTSDVLRKMRLQPMDDHGKDVAETCRNHGLFNLKSGNLLCSQIVVFLAQYCVEATLWFQKLAAQVGRRRATSKFCDKNLKTNRLAICVITSEPKS